MGFDNRIRTELEKIMVRFTYNKLLCCMGIIK